MKLLTIVSAIALLAYPFAIYYGLSQWGIGVVAAVLVLLFLLRIVAGNQTRLRELKYITWMSGFAGITLTLLAFLSKNTGWFTYYPVIVNILMFSLFFGSLWQKESMIERFARLQEPELPQHAVLYTRTVTQVWCAFFVINGILSFSTRFMGMDAWTLYNGLISYLLAGLLFTCELAVRLHIKRKNNDL